MLKRILLGSMLASLAGVTAHAATTITQKNCVVYSSAPTSGSPASALVPCDFLTDGTSVWPAFLPWDGTTFAGVAPANTAATAAQGGLVVTMEPNSAALAVTGTFWQTTQPVSGTFWQATQPVSGTFWQATQPISGTVAATESGAWNITNVSGTVSLPTGAATATLQTTGNTALTTINTTLGSPFQAGGSIGNTSFAATQSGAWTVAPTTATAWGLFADNAAWTAGTSVGATMGCEYTSGGATALTTGHSGSPGCTSARGVFTDKSSVAGTALGSVVSALGTLASGTPNAENVNAYIVGGAGSGGTAAADAAAWTAGSTNQTPIGCEYTSGGATALVSVHMGTVGCTTNRGIFTDKSSVNGTALATATEAYGTAFSSQSATVERVDAFVTNTNGNGPTAASGSSPTVTQGQQASGTALSNNNPVLVGGSDGTDVRNLVTNSSGDLTIVGTGTFAVQAAATLNATPTLANGNGVVPTQGGSVLSATNGGYTNVLQGNAVLSATNGLYGNLLQGNAALTNANPIFSGLSISGAAVSATNGEYTNLLQGNAVIASGNPLFTEITDGTNGAAAVKAASTAAVATDKSLVVQMSPNSPGIITLGPAAVANSAPFTVSSQYPTNATTTTPAPETISATGTTTAFTATLAAASSQTTFICGVEIDAYASTATAVTWTLTGTATGTMNFIEFVGTTTGGAASGENKYPFSPCIPASGPNTAIVVNAGAAGTGGVAAISAWGYKL